MRKCSEMQRSDLMAGCRAGVTVVFELYMAKGTVCIEHVVHWVVLDCFRIELDGLGEVVLLELLVRLLLDLIRLGHLLNTRFVTPATH